MVATIYLKNSGFVEINNLKTIQTPIGTITEFKEFLLQIKPYTFIGDRIVSIPGEEIQYIIFDDIQNT